MCSRWGWVTISNIVSVTRNKCRQCYTCVRNCPVNAVQIRNGQASIMYSRCISCGKCVKGCHQNAMTIINCIDEACGILKNNRHTVACLDPSYIAAFDGEQYKHLAGALKRLGFCKVWEGAASVAELAAQIGEFLQKNNNRTYIGSSCPAFVSMVEKHYPEVLKNLLPFVSPMIAAGRLIRKKYDDENLKIIYIGPCAARKAEAREPQFQGVIDCVITFDELISLFDRNSVDLMSTEICDFDSSCSGKGALFPIPSGFLRNLKPPVTDENEYAYVSGDSDCLNFIDSISRDLRTLKFADAYVCRSCVEGPKVLSSLDYYQKIDRVYEYYKSTEEYGCEERIYVDLFRSFKNKRRVLPYPDQDEIEKILHQTGKFTREDELNCGACGYNTCREKAAAVAQGIAEVDMCLPYLLSKRTRLFEELEQKFKEISLLKDEMETIIESSYDGLAVTDGDGKVLKANKSWLKIAGFDKCHVESSMQGMEDKGVLIPSSIMLALKERRRVSFIQNAEDGGRYLETCTPVLDSRGSIERVVINVRDIEALNRLCDQLEETMKLEKYHSGSDKSIGRASFESENIVANSLEFGKTLQSAGSVAQVESTVLILGESGVGKDVVAKLIHKLSKRNGKPLIKINCGAIPDNLLESELFGYETGAFTGAKTKGKPGLIELANGGTLFLDEIGELPLNLQVKLLNVIQDKKLMRLGGTAEKEIDVRIIAATNSDLYSMVRQGKFRVDLYYRLNVIPINIPPLRTRRSDILPLCYHFIGIYNKKYGCSKEFTPDAEKVLKSYSWPGNVRELENLVERLVVTTSGDAIDKKDLPLFLFQEDEATSCSVKVEGIIPMKDALRMVEKELIERAYQKYDTTYEMAEALGVNQSTVVRKIKRYLNVNALQHS